MSEDPPSENDETPVGAAAAMGQEPELIAHADGGLRIVRVRSAEDAAPFRASFAGAYQDIFAGAPYNERFYASEAMGFLDGFLRMPDHITLLAVKGRSRVVAFGIGVPVSARADIARELRGLVPVRHAFYLAELGVQESWRGHGLGRRLVDLRLQLVDRQRYSHVLLRTSAIRNASYQMYMDMGFEDMGVYMEVPARRIDGSVRTDRRLFLSRVLQGSSEGG
ncbi:MAG: GNAT family N-acetyltransferase [Alphaproteobacteria bacterium]|nr:GNAT family N-acetyltransferase [Alphaproteobacteria bacterium]